LSCGLFTWSPMRAYLAESAVHSPFCSTESAVVRLTGSYQKRVGE